MSWVRATGALALWISWAGAAAGEPNGAARQPSFEQTEQASRWIARSGDAAGRPYAIVDKKNAQIRVFDRAGRLMGLSPVLLGQAAGDHTVPGVGERAQTGTVPLRERTTPAGRFVSEPGRNRRGEAVVWVDYESAFAIHALRPGAGLAGRQARLASATPADNRASLGCVVVPVMFYQQVVQPALGWGRGIVYVLPENGAPLRAFSSH